MMILMCRPVQQRPSEHWGTEGIDELILALKTKDKDVRLGIIEALTRC